MMMDDETPWQDATLPADSSPIGPVKPVEAYRGDESDEPQDESQGDSHDESFDDLETGIASIFAALQAAGESHDGHAGHDHDDDPTFDEAHTFQLLSELDRLWQRPSR